MKRKPLPKDGQEGAKLDRALGPAVPAPLHARLADAYLDPANRTKGEVLRAAGYAASTAVKKPGEILGGIAARKAIDQARAERTSTARRVKGKALRKLDAALDDPQTTLQEAAVAAKVGHDIAKDEPDDGAEQAEERALGDRTFLRACRLAFRLGVRLAVELGPDEALAIANDVERRHRAAAHRLPKPGPKTSARRFLREGE